MVLFANNGEDAISAWDAQARTPYWCIECNSPLKLRQSKLKFPHFYHISASPSCRLYSKSERHLLIQLAIQKKLPPNEAQLEKPFPQIQRIADLVWEKKKIIFEIQCSPISENEAKARIFEYQSLGYEVIWILDDRLFNKKHVSRAENLIRIHSGYFISQGNSFLIFDQLETIKNRKRVKKGEKCLIDLAKVHPTPQINPTQPIPRLLKERTKNAKYYFENDWISKIT
jgi:competence protein CoiA